MMFSTIVPKDDDHVRSFGGRLARGKRLEGFTGLS